MHVNYRIEETERGTIISVFDDIDLANANLLADTLFTLIDTRRAVIVDLRGLRYIDSVGLHILLRASQRAQRVGCEMVVVAVRPTRQLIEQVGLDRLLPIVADLPPGAHAPTTAAPSNAPSAPPPAVPPRGAGVAPPSVAPLSTSPSIASRSVTRTPKPQPESDKPTEPSRTES